VRYDSDTVKLWNIMGLCASSLASSSPETPASPHHRTKAKKYRSPSTAHHLHHGEMSSWTCAEAETARPAGEFVVFLGKGDNVPNMDVGGRSDCYVIMSITDASGAPVSTVFRSTVRQDSLAPTWNTFVAFPVQPLDSDVLHLSLLDRDELTRDDAIGVAHVRVDTLRKHTLRTPKVLEIQRSTSVCAPDPSKPTTLTVSMLGHGEGPAHADTRARDAAFEIEKEFFLIRHGESKWNEGEKNMDVFEMLGVDHALNQTGVEQALSFNAKWKAFEKGQRAGGNEDGGSSGSVGSSSSFSDLHALQRRFLAAERVISSPLTRALETALLTCRDHPALDPARGGQDLMLFRNLREKKNGKMSLDTVGKATGPEIEVRVRKELMQTQGGALDAAMVDVVLTPQIDTNDCDSMWWTSASHGDSQSSLKMRFNELWGTLKYIKESSAVLVGHSLFFREMQRGFLGGAFKRAEPALAKELHDKKLDNAACLYVKVRFPGCAAGKPTAPEIVNARLLFGSRFKDKHEAEEGERLDKK
jgi:broad specificity phosphatase PhoE